MRVDTYQSRSAAQNDCSWYLFHDKLPQNMMLLEKKMSRSEKYAGDTVESAACNSDIGLRL